MKPIYKVALLVTISLVFLLTGSQSAEAAAYTSIASGNWSNNATWDVGGSYPGELADDDTVTIASGHAITVDVAITVASLSATNSSMTITHSQSADLIITGDMSLSSAAAAIVWNTNSYDLTVGGDLNFILSTSGATLNIGAAGDVSTVTVSGNITTSGSGGSSIAMSATAGVSSLLKVGGSWATTIFTRGIGTVEFTSAGAQSLPSYTYYNLVHSGAGTLTVGANHTVYGTLTNSNGIFDANTKTITAAGLATISGGEYQASTAKQTFNAGLTVSGGTLTCSSGEVEVNGGNLAVSSGTLTGSSGELDVNGDVSLSSTGILTAPSGAFGVSSSWTKIGGTFTPGSNTVTFDGDAVGKTINSGGTAFSTLTVNSPAGTGYWTLDTNNLSAATLNVTKGILDVGASKTVTVTGTSTIDGGTLSAASGNDIAVTADTVSHTSGLISAAGGGTITLTANTIGLTAGNDTISTTGSIILKPSTQARTKGLGGTVPTGDFNLIATEIAALTGYSSLTIGASGDTLAVDIDNVTFEGNTTIYGGAMALETITTTNFDVTLTAVGAVTDATPDTADNFALGSGGISITSTTAGIGASGTGAIDVTTTGQINLSAAINNNIYLNSKAATTDLGTVNVSSGAIPDQAQFNVVSAGDISQTGVITASYLQIASSGSVNLSTQDNVVSWIGACSVAGDFNFNGKGGGIFLWEGGLDTSGSDGDITLDAGTGNFIKRNHITVSAGAGTITFIADTIDLGTTADKISTMGSIVLKPTTTSQTVGIGDAAAGTFDLDAAEIAALTGYSSLIIGAVGNTGAVDIPGIDFEAATTIYGGSTTIGGSVSATGGALNIDSGSSTITQSAGTISTVTSGDITLTSEGGSTLQAITSAGALTLAKTTIAATYTVGAYIIDVVGNLTINPGVTLTCSGATAINTEGNWDNNGTFTASTSTITFDGLASATFEAGAASTYNDIQINKTGTDANDNVTFQTDAVTIDGALTITDGELIQQVALTTGTVTLSDASSKWANVTDNANVTLSGAVANTGTITFNPPISDLIQIRSLPDGTQYNWQGAGAFTMEDIDVKDQTCTGGTPANITVTSGTNSGNNINWVFGASTVSGTVYNSIGGANAGAGVVVTVAIYDTSASTINHHTASTDGSGVYAITDGTIDTGDIIVAYLDGLANEASAVTKSNSDGSSVANLHLYYDAVDVRDEGGGIANSDLANLDSNIDDDIKYTVAGGNLTVANSFALYINTGNTFAPGGNVTLTSADCRIDGTLTLDGAYTLALNTSGTLTINGTGTVNLDNNSAAIDLAGALDLDGNLDATGVSPNVNVGGDVDFTGGTFVAGSSTFIFDGTTILTSNTETLNNVQIGTGAVGGSLTLADQADINGNLTVQNGAATTLNLGGQTLLFSGSTFNLTNIDIFTETGSTVTFDGAALQTVTSISETYNIITVTNASVAGVAFADDFTTATLNDITPNSKLTFNNGDTYTITGAAGLNLDGQALGTEVIILSDNPGTQFTFDLTGGAQTVNRVNVTDSAASSNNITATNSVNNGGNDDGDPVPHWIFSNVTITFPSAGTTVGQTPTVIGTAPPGNIVILKGTVGAVPLQQVASATADALGNYIIMQSNYTSNLDIVAPNNIRAEVGVIQSPLLNINVVATPTSNQVPTIISPAEGSSINGNKPTITGKGVAGQTVTLTVKDAAGNLLLTDIATTIVDGLGNWTISSLDYTTNLVKGINYLSVTVSGTVSDIRTISLTDPFGIVFDSTTDNPIGGATVTIFTSAGIQCIPGVQIAATDLNPQITGADGAYSFLTINGNFYITVNALGYNYPSAKTSFPAGRVVVNGSKGEVFTVAGVIIEMDHPLDSGNQLLRIKKDVNKKEVVIGEVVTYTVTIKNETASDVTNVYLEDMIPAGFKYITDRAILDNRQISDPTGNRPITFNIGTVSSGQTRILKYQLVVGSGVTTGNYKNSAVCKYSDETIISNKDSETVQVTLDPLFDLGTVIGKVFWDKNEDGKQDEVQCKGGKKDGVSIREVGSMAKRDGFDRKDLQNNEEFSRHGTIRDDISDAKSSGINTVEYSRGTGSLSQQDIHSVPLSSEGLSIRSDYTTQDSISTSISSAKGDGKFTESMQRDSCQNQQSNQFPKEVTFDIGHTTYDKQEAGISNVRIVMEDGTIVTTDADGKYHIPAILPGRHILRIDERTLPKGVYLTTSKVVIVDITPGILSKVNFGVNIKGGKQKREKEKLESGIQSSVIASPDSVYRGVAISNKGIASSPSASRNDTSELAEDRRQRTEDRKQKKENRTFLSTSTSSSEPGNELKSEQANTQTYTPNNQEENHLFFIAMGDGKAGYNFNKGDMEPVEDNDKFNEGFWSEGKFAYYLKGKIKGKYLITSSLDTQREQKELFRNLDPDKYYPVYGDASTINYDATNTQGRLYLLIEWDKSKVLWGNYVTGMTDTEFAQFNRTLYGGKIHFESVSSTKFAEPVTKLIVFDARAKQRAAHNEFVGTGGSLFYLKHSNIIEGSEKIKIEIRDKITGIVLTTKQMQSGFDYEIDYSNGRVIFGQSVSSITESSSIISSQLLDGNSVYVVVDYEYETKDNYDKGTQGARLQQSFTDYVRIGGTYVKEQQLDKDYELKGLDATLHLGKNVTITAEQAESISEQAGNFISTDGGLSFSELSTSDKDKGKAYGIKTEAYLFDKLGLTSYYKKIEGGFSSTSTISQQGKELFGAGLTWDINPKTKLALSHDEQKLIDDGNPQTQLQVGAEETKTTSAQITHQMEKLRLTGEYRHQDVTDKDDEFESETNRDEDTVAAKADYELTKKLGISLEQQTTLRGETNNQTSVGISAKPNEHLFFKAKQTVGTEGSATSVGTTVNINDKTSAYTTLAVADSMEKGQTQSVVVGSQQKVNEGLVITTDKTYAKNRDTLIEGNTLGLTKEKDNRKLKGTFTQQQSQNNTETANTNIFGLSGDINDKLAMMGSFERGVVQNYDGTQATRSAGALGMSYVDKNPETDNIRLQASSKLELRTDDGEEDKKQYLIYNALKWQSTINTTLFAKINISQTENTSNDSTEAQYKELVTGIAYRPIYFDRLNLLARYTYIEDSLPSDQTDFSDIEEERAHTLSGEFVYDLTDKLQLVEKLAYKFGEEKVEGFDFTKTQTWLNIHRLNYNINNNWQFGAEYRFLTQKEAEDSKQGALVEVNRKIGEFVQIGAGYNFTEFNDDLTYLDYTSQGPFIRLTAMLYDRTPEEIERARQKVQEEKINQWIWELVNKELAKPNSPIMQKLNYYYNTAKKLQAEGKTKDAKELYEKIQMTSDMMYNEAEKYIRRRIKIEKEIQENNRIALVYYKQGKFKEAKELWEKITKEAKPEPIFVGF